jgi:hypothetical protein
MNQVSHLSYFLSYFLSHLNPCVLLCFLPLLPTLYKNSREKPKGPEGGRMAALVSSRSLV